MNWKSAQRDSVSCGLKHHLFCSAVHPPAWATVLNVLYFHNMQLKYSLHFAPYLLPCLSGTQYACIRFITDSAWCWRPSVKWLKPTLYLPPSFRKTPSQPKCCSQPFMVGHFLVFAYTVFLAQDILPPYFLSHSYFSKLISCQMYSNKSFLAVGGHNDFFSSFNGMTCCWKYLHWIWGQNWDLNLALNNSTILLYYFNISPSVPSPAEWAQHYL